MNTHRTPQRRQRGVATLIVVMVLFFIVTMVAAYASRNLIFEQRTGANIYRATQASEIAEAGLQWALARLNDGLIDEECLPDDTGPSSFRDRYLVLNAATAAVTPASAPSADPDWQATCVWDAASGDWSCACPVTAAAAPASAAVAGVAGAFRVRWVGLTGVGARPGATQIEVVACTLFDDACLTAGGGAGVINEGRAVVRQLVYQTGASISLPVAALTARGNVSALGLTVTNSRVGDSGITMHLGGDVTDTPAALNLNLNTLAGNALGSLDSAIRSDTALNPGDLTGTVPVSAAERFFANVFNMGVATARAQPGMLLLGDCGGSCTEDDVQDAADANPGRPIWIDGDLDVSADLGGVTQPLVLIVNGQLDISAAATIHGLVVLRPVAGTPVSWVLPTLGRVRGAVIVDGAVTGGGAAGTFEIDYDGELLRLARARTGSFVAVGGGWRDGSN